MRGRRRKGSGGVGGKWVGFGHFDCRLNVSMPDCRNGNEHVGCTHESYFRSAASLRINM